MNITLSEWLFNNPHMLLSLLISIIGFLLFGVSQALCAYRTKKWIRFSWFDLYNKREMTIAIIGIILFLIGFISLILLPIFYGYYFYNGNAHQWIFRRTQ